VYASPEGVVIEFRSCKLQPFLLFELDSRALTSVLCASLMLNKQPRRQIRICPRTTLSCDRKVTYILHLRYVQVACCLSALYLIQGILDPGECDEIFGFPSVNSVARLVPMFLVGKLDRMRGCVLERQAIGWALYAIWIIRVVRFDEHWADWTTVALFAIIIETYPLGWLSKG
jgi:hypothetical protein